MTSLPLSDVALTYAGIVWVALLAAIWIATR